MRPDTDNFLFPLRRLSPPPPANSPPAKPAVGSNTLPEAGYARSTDENCPTVCVACFSPCRLYNKLSVIKTLEKVQKSNVFIKVQEKHEYFEKK